jgi:fatty-acid desaturase
MSTTNQEILAFSNDVVDEEILSSQDNAINWGTVIGLSICHIGAIVALFFFSWQALLVSLFLIWVSGSLGIGMGYHRLLTHRGFKTPKAVEYFLTICGTLALEGGPIAWVATHRIHHAFSDREGDPHSPRKGFWWAHIGWILVGTAQQHDEKVLRKYAPDLMKDRFHVWLDKYYLVPFILLGVVLFLIGGLSMLLWGIFLRTIAIQHITWLVNSATHKWGSRRFNTKDDSTNHWFIALLTFGEGWHNNHHAHPVSARHGMAWYEIDINWIGIQTLKFLGLATSIKETKLSELEKKKRA